jgi:hypothetical protein
MLSRMVSWESHKFLAEYRGETVAKLNAL